MKILITGANGFIGKNLRIHLSEKKEFVVNTFTRDNSNSDLFSLVEDTDFVFHLAGVNRPKIESEFIEGNVNVTKAVCKAIGKVFSETSKKVPIVYTSSIQADLDNAYGKSKKEAEELILRLSGDHGIPVHIFRLPNVFGKWCNPNYNSMIATFCYNIARDLPIQIHNRASEVRMVYIDDVVERFMLLLENGLSIKNMTAFEEVKPVYTSTVGEVADLVLQFKSSRETLITEPVGTGFIRALYATYLSYLPKEKFSYPIKQYRDPRGNFVEMLKTKDSGQFSFFTANPGVTRGGHYHHTKNEKFLVIQGQALFRFRNLNTGEYFQLETTGDDGEVIETIPGWTHDITNIGTIDLIVMLWANEIFDRSRPDTFMCPIQPN
jgi:UDP-2-acetamido-2,6-beta-L-arabino-hexul-4-ose reductase